MAFLKSRNPDLHPRYSRIADHYVHWGDAWRVRWDYAFFQMMVETNALSYQRPDGHRGDVHESQNNFAGIGATGGGVPGERFADISSGVHAQIQHLVAYSGVPIRNPIAARTAKVQQYIVRASHRVGRPITFADLAGRWAADRRYGRTIEIVARLFNSQFCRQQVSLGYSDIALPVPRAKPARVRTARLDIPAPSYLGGPRPSFLAGPETEETLPWRALPKFQTSVQPVATVREADNLPTGRKAPANHAPKPNGIPPWRTIWTRENGPVEKEREAPLTKTVSTGAMTTAHQPAPERISSHNSETQNEGFWRSFQFPWFKIAPSEPEPSRLGGPLPLPSSPEVPLSSQTGCRVLVASYGGSKTLLLKSNYRGEMRLTALTVLGGFEKSMFETYTRATAPDAEVIGSYDTPEAALNDARVNCSTMTSTN